jgi:hypothetical protein
MREKHFPFFVARCAESDGVFACDDFAEDDPSMTRTSFEQPNDISVNHRGSFPSENRAEC